MTRELIKIEAHSLEEAFVKIEQELEQSPYYEDALFQILFIGREYYLNKHKTRYWLFEIQNPTRIK